MQVGNEGNGLSTGHLDILVYSMADL